MIVVDLGQPRSQCKEANQSHVFWLCCRCQEHDLGDMYIDDEESQVCTSTGLINGKNNINQSSAQVEIGGSSGELK